MPASAVLLSCSSDLDTHRPGAVHRAGHHRASRILSDRTRLAGDHGLVDIATALPHDPVSRNARAGPDQHEVSDTQIADGHGFGSPTKDAQRRIREQLGELLQRALGLRDRSHLEPVTEHHDRDEGRQLPPQVRAREPKCHGQTEDEGDADRERNQRHHAG